MTAISSEDFVALSKLIPEARFEYMLTNMIESNELWGLYGKNGWVMLKADDDACLPIWPYAEFAKAWVKDDFPDCEAKLISFNEWRETWLPGMLNNNTLILVFPLGDDEEGVMLAPQDMIDCIEEELA